MLQSYSAIKAEVEALRARQIHGLVLQNPVRMGEMAVRTAVAHLGGQDVEARIDTGATMVTGTTWETPVSGCVTQSS